MKTKVKSSRLCRDAMWFLQTSPTDEAAGLSGYSSGICGAIICLAHSPCFREDCLHPNQVFDILGIVAADWRRDGYLLPTPSYWQPEIRSKQKAYTARIMLLELAALLFEEQGD